MKCLNIGIRIQKQFQTQTEMNWRVTYRFHRAVSIFTESLPFAPSHFSQKLETFVIWMDRPRVKCLQLISLATIASK